MPRSPDGWTAPVEGAPEDLAARLAHRPGFVWLDGDASLPDGACSYLASDPVETCQRALSDLDPLGAMDHLAAGTTPTAGACPRWIGWVSYDAYWHRTEAGHPATRTLERARRHERRGDALLFGRYDAVIRWDHRQRRASIDAETEAAGRKLEARLVATPPPPTSHVGDLEVPPPQAHASAIEEALEHIGAGDIYQVNLARRWEGPFSGSPLPLFLAMRQASPVPFGALLTHGDVAVLSRTMETFLTVEPESRRVVSRPIKGTIARAGRDEAEASTLRKDPKERAEHSMIVDLMRNDLGRVAEVGTVRVEAPLVVEPYAGLSHLVSTVSATLRASCSLADLFRATFPPGSVTGTPKIRALEVIEALEPVPRGVYCGAVGYVGRDGGSRFAVAIRSAQVSGGRVYYHAGGGLVADSDPAREVAETELKAKVFLEAVAALRQTARSG